MQKIVGKRFMARRRKAGKRFLTDRLRRAVQPRKSFLRAEPEENAANPTIARMAAPQSPTGVTRRETEAAVDKGEEARIKTAKVGLPTRLARQQAHRNDRTETAFPNHFLRAMQEAGEAARPAGASGDLRRGATSHTKGMDLRAGHGFAFEAQRRTRPATGDSSFDATIHRPAFELTRAMRSPARATVAKTGPAKPAQGRRGFSTIVSALCQEAGVATSFCQASIRTSASPAKILR